MPACAASLGWTSRNQFPALGPRSPKSLDARVREERERLDELREGDDPAASCVDPQQVWDAAVCEALNEVSLGDDDSHGRMAAFEWLVNGCETVDVDVPRRA
ncbi:MAG TPA: hypothetical protein VGM03_14615 [Phycisphaerae bacterium]